MQNLFRGFRDEIKTLLEPLLPDKYFSYQTLLLLSLFSLLVATAVESTGDDNPWAVTLLTNLSWIFFVTTVWWALEEHPIKVYGFSISPWITGAVLCLFLFKPWVSDTRFRWALTCWPLISTGVLALPKFVDWELKLKNRSKSTNKTLVMTTLINLLLSSWILFHFRVQDWVNNYPSLLVGSFDRSAFVYDFERGREQQSQGVPLLEEIAAEVTEELNDQPWYQTERWLYTRRSRLETITRRAKESLDARNEGDFWQVEVPRELRPIEDGYFLDLFANWTGPTSRDGSFYVQKTCRILPTDRPRAVLPQTGTDATQTDEPPPTSRSTVVDCGELAVQRQGESQQASQGER
ncbi:DUF5357 family protein [cf. Phormidesmis sp. LEGE 11477]|uniref:DUF5357 family protein n=1 Tax=cf. Phormidesmis sp. LEGE 11477 TaxID=1828680 RepID=UPI00187E380C|nr:DUF5357 family protein [cf. Phormidesmis sp. LEGE 11477]MBE9064336.1 DUF5357 family protein [cf. Phormidesmis sp. LEGE 11477]